MAMPADVVTMITSDHRELERLFDAMEKDRSARPLMFPLALAMLNAHSRAEEECVYPAVAGEAGEEDEARHGAEEHHEAERLGQRLLAEDPESEAFDSGLGEFLEAVRHHIREEEDDVLPALGKALDADRLKELGEAFAARRAEELAGKPGSGSGSGSGSQAGERTRDELYEEARSLDIPGRSTMTKQELAREVEKTQAGS
jgi:hemerythrin superfamily protein